MTTGTTSDAVTPFPSRCAILGELWTDYQDDPEFAEFLAYNDIGVPLGFAVSEGFAVAEPSGILAIEESWGQLLQLRCIRDEGFGDLAHLLATPADPSMEAGSTTASMTMTSRTTTLSSSCGPGTSVRTGAERSG